MITDDILRGKAVRLTAVTEEDIPEIGKWYEDPSARRMFGNPAAPRSDTQLKQWLAEGQASSDTISFGIRLIESDKLIGTAGLNGYRSAHHTATAHIEIARAHRGQGFGFEAMQLVVEFGFRELNLHRIALSVASYNKAAICLYEKLGFKHEGTAREALQRDGEFHDSLLYGLLRQEWESN